MFFLCAELVSIHAKETESATVFIAAGFSRAMEEIIQEYESNTNIKVKVSYASSSVLARQIEAGASADLFLSANDRWMNYLEDKGLTESESRTVVATNRLAVISSMQNRELFSKYITDEFTPDIELPGIFEGRLSIGDPDHVPAGQYGKEALTSLGCWDALADRLAPAPSVTAATIAMEQNEAQLGVVYLTEAIDNPNIFLLGLLPKNSHSPIRFSMALCKEHCNEAESFYDFLRSNDVLSIYAKHGFEVAQPKAVADSNQKHAELTKPVGRDPFSPLLLSLRVSFVAAILSLVPGVAAGWLLARRRFPGKTLFEGMVHLPLVLPPVVTGYLLLMLLGANSWIGCALNRFLGLRLAFHWYAAVIAAMVVSFPLMVRSVRLALELIDKRLEEAAGALGASPLRVFLTISLPLAAPGILAGTLLVFARSLGEFGATITFAGNISGETRTLPLAIYTQMQLPGAENSVWTLVMMSIALSLVAMAASEFSAGYLRRRQGIVNDVNRIH